MDTHNNETQQQKNPGLMEAHEKMTWKVGEDIITFTGGEEKKPVAFVKLEGYEEKDGKKKPVFSSRDLDGNTISENTSNLYDLKLEIKGKEIPLTQAMRAKEEPQVAQNIETPASTEVASKIPEQQNVEKVPDKEKGDGLKKVRRAKVEKSKETEKTISH